MRKIIIAILCFASLTFALDTLTTARDTLSITRDAPLIVQDTIPKAPDTVPITPDTLTAEAAPDSVGYVRDTSRGVVIYRLGILFEKHDSKLPVNAKTALLKIAEVFTAHDGITVQIEGHTDTDGSRAMNLQLSSDRASAVKDFFIEQGVTADRLISVGHSFERPIADNETSEGRARNRRVELIVSDTPKNAAFIMALAAVVREVSGIIAIRDDDYDALAAALAALAAKTDPAPADTVVVETVVVDTVVVNTTTTDTVKVIDTPAPSYHPFLSIRPEYITIFDEVSDYGVYAEGGLIFPSGVFLTLGASGGAAYLGCEINIGYARDMFGMMKNVIGVSGGYHSAEWDVLIKSADGETLWKETGENAGFASVFLKVMPGASKHRLDITNRLTFGKMKNSVGYDKASNRITRDDGAGLMWSVSVGYSFTNGRGE